jgi:hypothetical protein
MITHGWMKKWVHNDDAWMDEKVHGRRLGYLMLMDGWMKKRMDEEVGI